jgi:hypothetical protein
VAELGVRALLMKILRLFFYIFALLTITGCFAWPWESYPSWNRKVIKESDVPHRILKAFNHDYPNRIPIRIEKSTFMSRAQNYPKRYKFWISNDHFVIYDGNGKLSDFTNWFPETKIQP